MKKENIPNDIKKRVDEFIKFLRREYGEEVISVTLYGSAASGEYAGQYSNVNVAVIMKDASIGSISKVSGFINKRRFMMINPVFFTEDYIKRSVDVFPIEFVDMKENHLVLYGRDIFNEINIDIKNLRFQCEQELKSKIINLKKLYLRTTDKILRKNILFKSFTSGLHILRNLIRLRGKEPAYAKEDVLKEIEREFGVHTVDLKMILDAKNGNRKLSHKEIDSLLTSLVGTLEKISDKVDLL